MKIQLWFNFGWLLVAVVWVMASQGCTTRDRASWARDFSGDRHYRVEQWSGGQKVREWYFKGVLNNQDSSDGFYWFSGDTLYEVSGTVTITSIGK
jgi:hypothetical protein